MKTDFFKGKVVFITGSSKGIGKATAKLLGSLGGIICINGRNEEALEACYQELIADNITCLPLAGDISDSAQSKNMIEKIIHEYGKLDILINNAGIGTQGKIEDLTVDAWEKAVYINMMGSVYMTTHALDYLLKAKGSVIFISTLAAKLGMPGHITYSVSKMGLSALAQAMNIELKSKGLHTGIVYVGFTENEDNKKVLYPDGTYRKMPQRKLKKATREEVARSIARVIIKRKKSVTLSSVGKLQAFALRFAPSVIGIILKKANRDYDNMYT